MNGATTFLNIFLFIKLIGFRERTLGIRKLGYFIVFWIHNVDTICKIPFAK